MTARLSTAFRLLALLLAGASALATAREYAVDVFVADEQELRQLAADGLIDDDELAILLGLLEAPVDLNTADVQDIYQLPGVPSGLAVRIVEERAVGGPYLSGADLQQRVPDVTPRTWQSMSAFTTLRLTGDAAPPIKGNISFLAFKRFRGTPPIGDDYPGKSKTAAQLGYNNWPAMALSAGLTVKDIVQVGLGGYVQEGLNQAVYDPSSRDLLAGYAAPLFRPYLAFARITRPKPRGELILGHYHAHYGHGLVLSTITGRDRHGFFVRQSALRGEDRLRPFDGFLGVAARAPKVRLSPKAELDLSSFLNVRPYDVYWSHLAVGVGERVDIAGPAEDPDADDLELTSPRVFVDGERILYQSIPNAIGVVMGGGDATLRFNRRSFLGVTGYGAWLNRQGIKNTQTPYDIILRQRWPEGEAFASVGVHAGFGFNILDLSGEVAVFFDGEQPKLAGYFVGEVEPVWGEFVFSVRHYDVGYANPFTRAEAAPDQVAGLRARNEDGVRLQFTLNPIKRFRWRIKGDLSRNIAWDIHNLDLDTSVRGDVLPFLSIGALLNYKNQNLQINGREHRYGFDLDFNQISGYLVPPSVIEEADSPQYVNRAGERFSWAAWVALWDAKLGKVEVRYGQSLTDNRKLHDRGGSCEYDWQVSHRVRVQGLVRPVKGTTVKAGVAYSDDDLDGSRSLGSADGPHSVFSWVELDQTVVDRVQIKARGGVGKRFRNEPSGCDALAGSARTAGSAPVEPGLITYEPDEYDLRFFGEFFTSVVVKF